MFTVLVNSKFFQGLINFGNPLIILFEERFMFNLSRKLHFSIIADFVLIILHLLDVTLNNYFPALSRRLIQADLLIGIHQFKNSVRWK